MGANDENGAGFAGDAMRFEEGGFQVDAMAGFDASLTRQIQGGFMGRKREDSVASRLSEDQMIADFCQGAIDTAVAFVLGDTEDRNDRISQEVLDAGDQSAGGTTMDGTVHDDQGFILQDLEAARPGQRCESRTDHSHLGIGEGGQPADCERQRLVERTSP